MATSWNAQITNGDYRIQFETTDRELYKIVEKACKTAIDYANGKKKECSVDRFFNWKNEFDNG